VFIDQDKSGQKIQISDKELEDEYNALKPEFKQAGVKVQQIVLKVAREDLDATVREKANGLVAKARGAAETTLRPPLRISPKVILKTPQPRKRVAGSTES
jgi:hypothetical protein